jgi:hypothetical protein
MSGLQKLIWITAGLIFIFCGRTRANFPEYGSNPFEFSIEGRIYFGTIFVVDLDDDSLMDFTYRDTLKLYAYGHNGIKMWSADIEYPGLEIERNYNYNHHGTNCGAADIDGDGQMEIAALNNNDEIVIYTGTTGNLEKTISLPPLGANQKAVHLAIANFRGQGDRDAVVQTCDLDPELHYPYYSGNVRYYVNRSLIAFNLENGDTLWTVNQDSNFANGYYEGYWGQAHGGPFCADVDGDGLDEVIGGNMIQEDGTIVDLGFSNAWVNYNDRDSYLDHIDCISVGDFRPDLSGLEWIITDEDKYDPSRYYTTMMSKNGIVWEGDATDGGEDVFGIWNLFLREPHYACSGNFDLDSAFCEVWVRSRLGGGDEYPKYRSQRPWIFDSEGEFITFYQSAYRLPEGFNTHPVEGNFYGIENIFTIDWTGNIKENIAAKARYVNGHIGVFDAMNLEDSVWTSMFRYPDIKVSMLYVADIAGDSREEMIIFDEYDKKLKVIWNDKENTNQYKPNKWDDPLYRRLKQNWNYYSPGGYTSSIYPLVSDISISNVTINSATINWTTNEMSDSQVEYGETESYGFKTSLNTTWTFSHSMQLTGLSINQDHHFRVISKNMYEKTGYSRDTVLTLVPFDSLFLTDVSVREDKHIMITWNATSGVDNYNVYRGTRANFVPDKTGGSNRIATSINDEEPGIADIQWTDQSVFAGDAATNYFYVITAISGGYETAPSNVMGAFDFLLSRHFNSIGLPLILQSVTNASQLTGKIPGCTSVALWNSEYQGYEQYVPDLGFNNFSINMGHPYYVHVTEDTTITFVGNITSPSFNLITTGSTNFNEIMVPLDKTNITTAAELCADISGSNCVAYWDAGANPQGFKQYYTALPGFNNFDVRVGYPYYVNVTSNVVWPSGGSPKRIVSQSKVIERAHLPHLVWGELDDRGDYFIDHNIKFRAYITERPKEILTEMSPGCAVTEDIWVVQCSSFPSVWDAGDILYVEIIGNDNAVLNSYEIELSYEPGDKAGDALSIKPDKHIPSGYSLGQNYPNPLNPSTTIDYQVPVLSRVKIEVYNTMGQKVISLLDKEKDAGYYSIKWMGLNEHGIQVPSGLYTVRMVSENFIRCRKMLLVR